MPPVRWFSLFILAASLLFGSAQAFGKQVWIDVVGIDEVNNDNNPTTFYQSASEFSKLCTESAAKPECQLFMNSSPRYAMKYGEAKKYPTMKAQAPSQKSVLSAFQSALASAQSGDTVILSLENHGSPASEGNSCVWMSHSDYICETDLQKILAKKPPGVKVFINADACFSGAFADLSSKDTCVATWADRQALSADSNYRLWAMIRRQKAQTLSDLEVPMSKYYQANPIMASQSAMNMMCSKLRKATGGLIFNFPTPASNSCVVNETLLKQMSDLNTLMKALSPIQCADAGFDAEACASLNKLNAPAFSQKLAAVNASLANLTALQAELTQPKWSMAYSNDVADVVKVGLDENLPADQIVANLPQDQRALYTDEVKRLTMRHNALPSQINAASAKTVELARQLGADGDFQAWQNLEACLFDIKGADFGSAYDYLQLMKQNGRPRLPLFPRTFKMQDVREAESCEASIHF